MSKKRVLCEERDASLERLREENRMMRREALHMEELRADLLEELSIRKIAYADYLQDENDRLKKELRELRIDCIYFDDKWIDGMVVD